MVAVNNDSGSSCIERQLESTSPLFFTTDHEHDSCDTQGIRGMLLIRCGRMHNDFA